MKQDEHFTKMVFRQFEGETIALMPEYLASDAKGGPFCDSYMHTGQHGAASYEHIMKNSQPSTPEQIKTLKVELENRGYKVKPVKRRSSRMYDNFLLELYEYRNKLTK